MPDEGYIKLDIETVQELRDEVVRLRREVRRLQHLQHEGTCRYAGPGRGDCENFVGLPGHSIPGQHDGLDDTVDHYGKPNGWCWHCWLMHQRDDYSRHLRVANEEVEQLRVQLAGCGVAATDGSIRQEAQRGAYGWSASYASVLDLRRAYDDLSERFDQIVRLKPEVEEETAERPSRWEILGSD